MILLLSPAKTLDFSPPKQDLEHTQPEFVSDARDLVDTMRGFSPDDLSQMMGISERLGQMNFERFLEWDEKHKPAQAKQAVLAFQGDVYQGLNAERFSSYDLKYAQKHLRILSGLYGVLRPLDLIHPYRLEMGTRLATKRGKNLYEFWGEKITHALREAASDGVLINLASQEYYGAVQPELGDFDVYTPVFKDKRGDKLKIISFYAKKARGAMAAWAIHNQVKKPKELLDFSWNDYEYAPELSGEREMVFTRESP